jgi:hypothetical protein
MHTSFTPVAYHEPDRQVHAAYHCEHDYHESLHSVEVAQLYPQVGDFIAS